MNETPPGTIPDPMAWDPASVAAFLKISERHLRDIRREDPSFPPPRMLGTEPRWYPQVIRDWLAAAKPEVAGCEPVPRRQRGASRVH